MHLEPREPERSRVPLRAILAVIAIALVGGVVAAVVTFVSTGGGQPDAAPSDNRPGTATAPAADNGAPANLAIRDDSTSITLTWTDPTKGTVPFIVAGGQDGAGVRPLHTLLPGTTTHTVSGLNPRLEYCFTIAAVYDTDRVGVSDLVCTRRGVSSRPSR